MKIAVEGCAHGELENIYNTIQALEQRDNIKIDLLLCCGDFQSSRNEEDLRCMAVPPKYYNICSFYKYYSGEKLAPILTILIGGNHEASNYLQELPYGGWVAPRIYYLGYAGVVDVAGIRIGGLSGIYKSRDYTKGHFEISPYNDSTKRSVYHVRNLEVFRLKQLSPKLDIFLSHDWPVNVTDYGNKEQLIRFKPHFQQDIENKELGSVPCQELLGFLKPKYWFSAHLHCKFAALIPHNEESSTKFLALDKCLPKRRFLQVLDVPHNESEEVKLKYDLEWLSILMLTNHLLSIKPVPNYMPGPNGNERHCFTPSEDEKSFVLAKLNNELSVPENFQATAKAFQPDCSLKSKFIQQPDPIENQQTVQLCNLLSIDDPIRLILKKSGQSFKTEKPPVTSGNLQSSDSPVVGKRLSLNLPKPKNESGCDLFFIDTGPLNTTEDESVRSFIQTPEKNMISLTKNELENSSVEDGKNQCKRLSSDSEDNPTSSNVKKVFKRRNLDLYKEDII